MARPNLIGIDKTEATYVRRALHHWTDADEKAVTPLLGKLQCKYPDLQLRITKPRWETNVYPLYYWAHETVSSKKAYGHVLEILQTLFVASNVLLSAEDMRANLTHI